MLEGCARIEILQKLRRKKREIFILRRQTVSAGEACNPGDIPRLQRKQLGGLVKSSQQPPSGVHTSTACRTRGTNASLLLVQTQPILIRGGV